MNNPLFDTEPYDDDISYKELFEEVHYLRERISQLEVSNSNLQITLDETQVLKLQLENTILTQTKQMEPQNNSKNKRVYKRKKVSKEIQGINAYYLENKNNEDIKRIIKTKMNEVGYDISKNVPAQLMKMECLKRFNQLDKTEQQKYMNEQEDS